MATVASEEELIRWVESGLVEYAAVRDLLSLAARSRFEGVAVAGSNPQQVTKTPSKKPINFATCKTGFAITFEIPLKLISEANKKDGIKPKLRRKKEVKQAVRDKLQTLPRIVKMPCVVVMTRFGPRKLDSDNLDNAFKSVRDMVAEWIGVDDGDQRYQWRTKQRQSKGYKIRISIWCGA